ncbi:hypothetical protein F4777DRAFT_561786 [Nemania sp. FL0916]|nr:hypothetical protein F4777DRAFT_561786 [Nemania sp. FL0916]
MRLLRSALTRVHSSHPLKPRLPTRQVFHTSSILIPQSVSIGTEPRNMDSKIDIFEAAMQKVYGPYNISSQPDTTWQPGNAGGHRGRYLWTDAFGVVNFITLSRERHVHSAAYLHLARQLANTVHDVLGREREPSSTSTSASRLPGATDEEPLNGGLRIGKLAENGPDGDGMYHHYLTLWMFALDVLARATGEMHWNTLAVQLAQAIHPHFMVLRHGGRESMVWKISTDMRRVLVASQGHLDDVTGFAIYSLLRDTAARFGTISADDAVAEDEDEVLGSEIRQYARIMAHEDLSLSGDPLDLGMGLWVAHLDRDAEWARELSAQAADVARRRFLDAATTPLTAASRLHRLAFREFGACLGIKCYGEGLDTLMDGVEAVLDVWKQKVMEEDEDDEDLRPINLVMYAAALIPGGKLNFS